MIFFVFSLKPYMLPIDPQPRSPLDKHVLFPRVHPYGNPCHYVVMTLEHRASTQNPRSKVSMVCTGMELVDIGCVTSVRNAIPLRPCT